jgi:DNA repair protein RecN (Recombination protein N)
VTHLPHIAAYADAHFRIAKRERDGRTVTEVVRLDRPGRAAELAEMIGGPAGGPASMAGAIALLERAEATRARGGDDRTAAVGVAVGPGRRSRPDR